MNTAPVTVPFMTKGTPTVKVGASPWFMRIRMVSPLSTFRSAADTSSPDRDLTNSGSSL